METKECDYKKTQKEIEKAIRIHEDIKTITNQLLLYALQRSIEERIENTKLQHKGLGERK